ncbi:DUF5615 family PIN-like protein [Mucilaginibacter polytrichastri]|uniref:DUF5615 family PIN-like protein n=1 Tax=Mucilaginibacter polytrichastri TaxID=1302689 RepID=UPI0008E58312|nr:DUF5615 family PIN-like protein [Mucilaginibacter polytrichastri]SFS71593.1 Predicted nuclease, contains PIN domain, potential toxin-antitoxin system component [Mucilaginibacter polytrichastri]
MLNFLVDVHLPISLSKFLDKHPKCSSTHVNQILQKWNTTDTEICNYADANLMIVITKDSDFKDTHFIKQTPKKVIKVALGNISNNDLLDIFEKYLSFILSLTLKESFYIEISKEQIIMID